MGFPPYGIYHGHNLVLIINFENKINYSIYLRYSNLQTNSCSPVHSSLQQCPHHLLRTRRSDLPSMHDEEDHAVPSKIDEGALMMCNASRGGRHTFTEDAS